MTEKREFTSEELGEIYDKKKAKVAARKLPAERDSTESYKKHIDIWAEIKTKPMRDLTDEEKKTRKLVEEGSPYTHVVEVSKKNQAKEEITRLRRNTKLSNRQAQRDTSQKKRVLKERKKKKELKNGRKK